MKKILTIIGIAISFLIIPIFAPIFVIIYINKYRVKNNKNKMTAIESILSYLGMLTGYFAVGFIISLVVGVANGNSVSESIDIAYNGASSETETTVNTTEYEVESMSYTDQNAVTTNEASVANTNVVYFDECVVKEFHRVYEKYAPKADESLTEYFGRAYGDMLDESYEVAQQSDSYDRFEGMHNVITIGNETAKDNNTYDYEDLINNTQIASYNNALQNNYGDSLVKLRVQVLTAYENSYVILPEASDKYIYNNDNPYIAYFASNSLSVTNKSDYEARHILSSLKANEEATIIGKIIGTKNIDKQTFPIFEIQLARKISASEDSAINNEMVDINSKRNIVNGLDGYAELRSEPGYDSSVVAKLNNGTIIEFATVAGYDENGNQTWVNQEPESDSNGYSWYNVIAYTNYGTYSGWINVLDIDEEYVY